MSTDENGYRLSAPDEVIRYVKHGYHAFVGCDDLTRSSEFARSLNDALSEHPTETLDGCDVSSSDQFTSTIEAVCQNLIEAVGQPSQPGSQSVSCSMELAMRAFGSADRQGFLLVTNMDTIVRLQRTIEIEGPMRSVMQLYDDVAVVLFGSNDCINNLVGDYDRPFYMSFHVFRI